MGMTRYRVEPLGNMKRAAKGLSLALLGIAGLALWQNRERLGSLVQDLADRFGANGGGNGASRAMKPEVIPEDYDYNRPSVFNSTAMAGPRGDAVGAASGLDGGSMGTDLGTQGEGAI